MCSLLGLVKYNKWGKAVKHLFRPRNILLRFAKLVLAACMVMPEFCLIVGCGKINSDNYLDNMTYKKKHMAWLQYIYKAGMTETRVF